MNYIYEKVDYEFKEGECVKNLNGKYITQIDLEAIRENYGVHQPVLEYRSRWGIEEVQVKINYYKENNGIYVGLESKEDGYFAPYCNITVNLGKNSSNYCGYIDMKTDPNIVRFLEENKMGEFLIGAEKESGYCTYPLFMFNPENLAKLDPVGFSAYEKSISASKEKTR